MKNKNNISLYAFRKYGDAVLKTAYACCGSYAEAEDITQDVFSFASSENRFSTMLGEIICSYEKEHIHGKGDFYYDNKNHDEYINVKRIYGSTVFTMKDGE